MLKFKKKKNRNPTKLFTAIVRIMTSVLCYVTIYEKVTSKCAKNGQYLKVSLIILTNRAYSVNNML